jgi:hypothetical protein
VRYGDTLYEVVWNWEIKFCIEFQKAVVNVLAIAVMSRSKVPTLLK